jgi:hypothetical protein
VVWATGKSRFICAGHDWLPVITHLAPPHVDAPSAAVSKRSLCWSYWASAEGWLILRGKLQTRGSKKEAIAGLRT